MRHFWKCNRRSWNFQRLPWILRPLPESKTFLHLGPTARFRSYQLFYRDENAPITLQTDTSDYEIGGYLFQTVDGTVQVIMCVSKVLEDMLSYVRFHLKIDHKNHARWKHHRQSCSMETLHAGLELYSTGKLIIGKLSEFIGVCPINSDNFIWSDKITR